MKRKNTEKGQSLFEMVVALAISALIVTAIVALASNSIQNAAYSRDKNLAAAYVQENLEWLRKERDSNSTTFLSNAAIPDWCFQDLTWVGTAGVCASNDYISNTKFLREASFNVTSLGTRNIVQIDVTVSWQDSKGTHQADGATELADHY